MRHPSSWFSARRLVVGASLGLLALTACDPAFDRRGCPAAGNSVWLGVNWQGSINVSGSCPISASHFGQSMSLGFSIIGPGGTVTNSGVPVDFFVYNHSMVQKAYATTTTTYWTDGTSTYASPATTYPIATDRTGADSAIVRHPVVGASDYAKLFVQLPWNIPTLTTSLVSSGSGYQGQLQTYTSSSTNGASISRTWYKNGTVLSGVTGTVWTYTPTAPDAFVLKVVTNSSDGQTKTDSLIVDLNWTLVVNGPRVTATRFGNCTWSAAVNGGKSPITYQWWWLGSAAGTGTSMTQEVDGTSALQATVTDANGNTKTVSFNVTISGSGSPCPL